MPDDVCMSAADFRAVLRAYQATARTRIARGEVLLTLTWPTLLPLGGSTIPVESYVVTTDRTLDGAAEAGLRWLANHFQHQVFA